MPMFRYKAVAASGEVVDGEMEAASQSAVIQRLQSLGHLPISAEAAAPESRSLLQRDIFAWAHSSDRDVAITTREMATLIDAGMPIDRSLEILVELAERQRMRETLSETLDALRGGASLSAALAAQHPVFPQYYISMVRAGEAGGALGPVFTRLAEFLERRLELRERVRSALIYPAILVVMSIIAVVVLLTVVVPRFRPLFDDAGAALPVSTRIVVGFGDAFAAYWWVMAAAIVAVILIARAALAHPPWRFAVHRALLAIPLVGDLIVKAVVAGFARTLGTLVANGVGLLDALALANESVSNSVLSGALRSVAENVRQGRNLAEPLAATGRFPPLAISLMRVGEETGRLDHMLLKTADIYEDEVKRTVDRLLALLVPALTIVLGLLIAGIIGSILAAILSVYRLPY